MSNAESLAQNATVKATPPTGDLRVPTASARVTAQRWLAHTNTEGASTRYLWLLPLITGTAGKGFRVQARAMFSGFDRDSDLKFQLCKP